MVDNKITAENIYIKIKEYVIFGLFIFLSSFQVRPWFLQPFQAVLRSSFLKVLIFRICFGNNLFILREFFSGLAFFRLRNKKRHKGTNLAYLAYAKTDTTNP